MKMPPEKQSQTQNALQVGVMGAQEVVERASEIESMVSVLRHRYLNKNGSTTDKPD